MAQENKEKITQNWEEEKIEMKRKLFTHVETFLVFDASVNNVMLDFLKIVKQNYEKDPSLFSDNTSGMKEILNELKKKIDNGETNDIKGNDIIGAGPLQDIIEFIKSISIDLIKEEKEFFMQIIKLIFCGC